ncbi:helix-turn-helix transcriptional regulator [Streptomyces spinoverrucosus]|nr:helix-turn-helix transcriptional regulator [Streptomyces spinoverrucosus]
MRASDPISEAGLKAAMRDRAELEVVGRDDLSGLDDTAVGVVASESLDDEALKLARSVRGAGAQHIVLVASSLDENGVVAAAEEGVSGLVRRCEATPDRLVQVITSVRRGAGVVPPDLLGRLIKQVSTIRQHALAPRGIASTGLTEREAAVLRLVAKGLDTREIAQQLLYSERTVKNALHDVTSRFHLRNRSHAVAYAIREGMI